MKSCDFDQINHDITTLIFNDVNDLPEKELNDAIENTLTTLLEGQDAIARLLAGCFDGEMPTAWHLSNIGSLQSFMASLTISLLKVKDGALYRNPNDLQLELQEA